MDAPRLAVLGSDGFVGRALVAAGRGALQLNRKTGSSPDGLREALATTDERVVVVHAAGSVGRDGPPDERAYLESTERLFGIVASMRPRATILTVGSIIETRPVDSAYADVKRRQAAMALELSTSVGIAWRHLRMHNLIGPDQAPTAVAPAMAARLRTAMAEGDTEFPIRDGAASRDWLDVRDVVRMILAIAERIDRVPDGEPIEVCSGRSRTVRSIAEALVAAAAANIEIVDAAEPHASPLGDTQIEGDPNRLLELLGEDGRPRFQFERSIADLWEAVARSTPGTRT